ncbi:MAG: L-serine ammonia-lyase, iron-sulfur-dependent subunit beta [Peptostreptococcaceae bacterium]|nr:L-serine ammonia-lyase, iron-sulfur-dependent subunit beta [Peptostreptococcaceae bacterium]
MNIYDIIGPIMIGPSSSHTAGAVKIGYIARKLMAENIAEAGIYLYGSFLATGKGHGTSKALVAGLLGMKPDNDDIPSSFDIAKESGMQLIFGEAEIKDGHPNSVMLSLKGVSGKKLELIGESLGGGRINIAQIDGLPTNFSGEHSTLVIRNHDEPGYISEVTAILANKSINVAKMELHREKRSGNAVMVLECDHDIPKKYVERLERLEGISKVICLNVKGGTSL